MKTNLTEKQARIVNHPDQIFIRAEMTPGNIQTVSLHQLAVIDPRAAFAEAFRLAEEPGIRPTAEIRHTRDTIKGGLQAVVGSPHLETPVISMAVLEALDWVLNDSPAPHIEEIINTHAAVHKMMKANRQ